MSNNNLEFWESVEKTNPANTKGAKIGQLNITAINATSQSKEATSKWGMYGKTWGLKEIVYNYMDIGETKLALVGAKFYYPDGEFELHSSIKVCYKTNGANGYLKIDDDFMKKIETDLTTKGLSKVGFNTDVFMGYYDDNKYIQKVTEEFKPPPKLITEEQVLELVKLIAGADTTMDKMFKGLKWDLKRLEDINPDNFDYLKDLLEKKIAKK